MENVGLLSALPMNEIVFFINKVVISGMIIGSVYALGAVGLTLVWGILRFANFAHGDLMTFGAFMAFVLTAMMPGIGAAIGLPTAFVVMPIAMLITAGFTIFLDKAFYQPLRKTNPKPITLVIASFGVMLMLQGLIRLIWGTAPRNMYVGPKEIYRVPFGGRDIIVTEPQLLLILFTVASIVALHFFLTRSRTGKAMRAMSDNADLARISGISTQQVVRTTWIISGSLAAAAGTLLAMDVSLKPDLSFNLLLPIVAAMIVGGIGQPYGAISGGLIVGFTETISVFNWAILLRPFRDRFPEWLEIPANISFVPTEYKLVVPFVILVAVLIWRPNGIFRGKVL